MTYHYTAKVKVFSFDEAMSILEALGCQDDPVFYKRKEINIGVIEFEPNNIITSFTPTNKIRLKFYNGTKWINGTLQSMVLNRLRG